MTLEQMRDALALRVKEHEGLRLKPYFCTAKKLTIGWGRNLEDRGINEEEADAMLRRDLREAELGARNWMISGGTRLGLSSWDRIGGERQTVLAELVFWIGAAGLARFFRFRKALLMCHFEVAADELLFKGAGSTEPSKLYTQVPARTERLAEIIRKGTL